MDEIDTCINTLLITFCDCIIESEHVIQCCLPHLNNKIDMFAITERTVRNLNNFISISISFVDK